MHGGARTRPGEGARADRPALHPKDPVPLLKEVEARVSAFAMADGIKRHPLQPEHKRTASRGSRERHAQC